MHGSALPAPELAWVRELARQVAELAAQPENQRIIQRWRDVNALRRPDRAPVWCRPVGAWSELLPESDLRCHHRQLRELERHFRRILIKRSIGDDEPLDPWYPVGPVFACEPADIWGVPVGRHSPKESGGAWAYDPPIKTLADLAKLRRPVFRYDAHATAQKLEHLQVLLDGQMPVRLCGGAPLHSILGTYVADLRGLAEMMLDMAVEPELIHQLTAHLRDSVLASMDVAAAAGVVTPNHHGPMTTSDPLPDTGNPDPFQRCWIMTNSQEYDQVSPAMWEEFCLNYQLPIIARYGLAGYGCCESLNRKMTRVLQIPNLRILVCSAWTHLPTVCEQVGLSKVIMWRQKASAVVLPHDLAPIAHDLEEGAQRLRGLRYQIVLRELQTLAGHPHRLHDWTRLAIAAAEKYA